MTLTVCADPEQSESGREGDNKPVETLRRSGECGENRRSSGSSSNSNCNTIEVTTVHKSQGVSLRDTYFSFLGM